MQYYEEFLDFLSAERNASPHTLTSYGKDLNQFNSFLSDAEISESEIERNHIRHWLLSFIQKNYKPASVRRKHAALSSYFQYLQKRKIISHNPASGIDLPKINRKLPKVPSPRIILNVINTLLKSHDDLAYRDGVLLRILYEMGLRRSELLNLRCSDFNTSSSYLKITGKGNKSRTVPVSPELKKILSEYIHRWDLKDKLWMDPNGRPLVEKEIYNIVKFRMSQPGEAHVTPHDLRHAFATHLLNGGADLKAIKDLLGHSSLATSQIYIHTALTQIKNSYQKAHPRAE